VRGEHVVEPPADVPLLHVAPRRPPREQVGIVGLELAVYVSQAATDDAFNQRPFFRKLSDRARFPFLRMHVHVGPRDVHVAAQHERQTRILKPGSVRVEGFEELHLRRKILAAVGDVDRRDSRLRQAHRDDAVLVIEFRVMKRGPLGMKCLAHVKPDAGVALAAVPVAPVALELAQPDWQLVNRRLDLLQAEHVRLLAFEVFLHLRLTRADAVDIPGRNLHRGVNGDGARATGCA